MSGTTFHLADGTETKKCDFHYLGPDGPCLRCKGTGWFDGEPAFEVRAFGDAASGSETFIWSASREDRSMSLGGYPTRAAAISSAVEALG